MTDTTIPNMERGDRRRFGDGVTATSGCSEVVDSVLKGGAIRIGARAAM
jgi:hypothetical protein